MENKKQTTKPGTFKQMKVEVLLKKCE